jgi:hypothetical protein
LLLLIRIVLWEQLLLYFSGGGLTSDVSAPKQQSGATWSIDDLPISAYEYNTPKEAAQIIRHKEKGNKKRGLVFASVVAAFFIFIISVIISNNFGVIFGSLVGTGIIIAGLYKRANDRAGITRQSHVLKRIQQKAAPNAPRTYQPYTGWVTPTLEQIKKAERRVSRVLCKRVCRIEEFMLETALQNGWRAG